MRAYETYRPGNEPFYLKFAREHIPANVKRVQRRHLKRSDRARSMRDELRAIEAERIQDEIEYEAAEAEFLRSIGISPLQDVMDFIDLIAIEEAKRNAEADFMDEYRYRYSFDRETADLDWFFDPNGL